MLFLPSYRIAEALIAGVPSATLRGRLHTRRQELEERKREALLDRAFQESPLPDEERDRRAVHQFLVDCRLGRASVV